MFSKVFLIFKFRAIWIYFSILNKYFSYFYIEILSYFTINFNSLSFVFPLVIIYFQSIIKFVGNFIFIWYLTIIRKLVLLLLTKVRRNPNSLIIKVLEKLSINLLL